MGVQPRRLVVILTPVPGPRLLAIDVDGTLLRSDGSIAPQDREAIAAARNRGIVVTLATGRLSSSTLPVAHELGLVAPLVCADGAVLFCPSRGEPLELHPLPPAALAAWVSCLRRFALAPFFFSHDTVFGAAAHAERFPFVAGWTPNIVACDEIEEAAQPSRGDLVTAIGIGPAAAVAAAEAALRETAAVGGDVTAFPIGATGHWALRMAPSGCTKATGLERLAHRLGLGAADVVAIGDWYNDLPMLAWAGWSFAMGQAPADVKSVARHTLVATAGTGGGIAEALDHLRSL